MAIKDFTIVDQGSNYQIVKDNKESALFSYGTCIAIKNLKTDQVVLDENYWDFSHTTNKHRNLFLNEGIAETRKKIKSREYKLKNLN